MGTNDLPGRVAGITGVTVTGFKSLRDETSIDIRPLTVLAGANSSGKSSILQPFLLLKQTLETTYDPGVLSLAGEHASFSDFTQTLWRGAAPRTPAFTVRAELGGERWASLTFFRNAEGIVALDHTESGLRGADADITWKAGQTSIPTTMLVASGQLEGTDAPGEEWEVGHARWLPWLSRRRGGQRVGSDIPFPGLAVLNEQVGRLIHVRAVRERPTRQYPNTRLTERYAGPFEPYVASLIAAWEKDPVKRDRLDKAMQQLGLTAAVRSRRRTQGDFEVRVARLTSVRAEDFDFDEDGIDLADVGMGVSQVLPVLVALLAGDRERLVYIEEPELHLHPRAQAALAAIIVEAIEAGARVVIETHSALLLLALQTHVAQKHIEPDQVALHWFSRDAEGVTRVTSGALDDKGTFGNWPGDFTDTEMDVQVAYLNAGSHGGA